MQSVFKKGALPSEFILYTYFITIYQWVDYFWLLYFLGF